ncbi:hypothetical protein GCM10009639_43650 [Kitasatospora putterlickiae]|uniref:Secreted protein n=1 Tax=Kitasatospora putterlickiae TaxID=221725 RepID=A0ABP4IXA9_9ACTN
MRKLFITTAAGLTVLGLALPVGTADAAPAGATAIAGATCDARYNQYGTDGNVRAWSDRDCSGTLLGTAAGNDANWGDGDGPFQGSDDNSAGSVMNTGYAGGKDVVAFYRLAGGGAAWASGYNCLKRSELYVDDLSRNYYTTGQNMNDSISSHEWVYASGCARFMS